MPTSLKDNAQKWRSTPTRTTSRQPSRYRPTTPPFKSLAAIGSGIRLSKTLSPNAVWSGAIAYSVLQSQSRPLSPPLLGKTGTDGWRENVLQPTLTYSLTGSTSSWSTSSSTVSGCPPSGRSQFRTKNERASRSKISRAAFRPGSSPSIMSEIRRTPAS